MTLGKSSIERAAATVNPEESIKQPENSKADEKKTVKKAAPAKAGRKRNAVKKTTAAKKTSAKADEVKSEVKAHVVTGTDKQVFATIAKDKGINAHYGVNDELPTFLL